MTRVVVIDPQPAVRSGLAMLLRTEPGLVPVGAAVGAHDGLELASRQRPDVVLLDPKLHDDGERNHMHCDSKIHAGGKLQRRR